MWELPLRIKLAENVLVMKYVHSLACHWYEWLLFIMLWFCKHKVSDKNLKLIIFCPFFFYIYLMQIDLMISGNEPVKAMTYICDLLLFSVVFSLPPIVKPAISEECDRFVIFRFNLFVMDINWLKPILYCHYVSFPNSSFPCLSLFLPHQKNLKKIKIKN